MAPDEFKQIRLGLGLTLSEAARLLGYEGEYGADQIRAMERGKKVIMPAQRRLMMAYRDGYRPDDWEMGTG